MSSAEEVRVDVDIRGSAVLLGALNDKRNRSMSGLPGRRAGDKGVGEWGLSLSMMVVVFTARGIVVGVEAEAVGIIIFFFVI